MKFLLYFILLTLVGFNVFTDIYGAIAFGLSISLAVLLVVNSNESIVFREWTLLLYAVNYLLSPAISYELDEEKIVYAMKIPSGEYFSLALPGFFLFAIGVLLIPTDIFKPNFTKISKITIINERFLFQLTLTGILCRLFADIFSSDFAFFIYLVSLLRFLGVFALFAFNPKKYSYLVFLIISFEIYNGFKSSMFHDAIMWVIFFAIFYVYVKKPSLIIKLGGSLAVISFVLLVQAFKSDYRERVWRGGEAANIETISEVSLSKANSGVLLGEDNLFETLNRGNQAWIFASTVDNMDRTKDFQGINNVKLYLESALLPRFLAKNKIGAGDRFIFNKFSGHTINEGTSMGLGVFSDGYIAYGDWGVYCFTFGLGLLFSVTFRLIQHWSKISPFYVLLFLPMLNYAVRPDCELQTTINHLAKSTLFFGGLVYLTKYRFTLNSRSLK